MAIFHCMRDFSCGESLCGLTGADFNALELRTGSWQHWVYTYPEQAAEIGCAECEAKWRDAALEIQREILDYKEKIQTQITQV